MRKKIWSLRIYTKENNMWYSILKIKLNNETYQVLCIDMYDNLKIRPVFSTVLEESFIASLESPFLE
jgi:hypothetical protein